MIIKSKGMSIKAVGNVIKYILREGAQLKDSQGQNFLLKQHLRGKEANAWTEEFIANEHLRKKKNKRSRGFYHVILSLHPKDSDHVSIAMLKAFVQHFISLRCPNSLVIATAHQEAHIHIHLIISGVQYGSFESIRIEKGAFAEILKDMQAFQEREYRELEFSNVHFGKKTLRKDAEYQMRSKGTIPEKQLAIAYVKAANETSKSLDEFVNILKEHNFEPYYRNGFLTGIKGIRKYRFTTMGISMDRFRDQEKELIR